jgi:hypothetical protein
MADVTVEWTPEPPLVNGEGLKTPLDKSYGKK